MTLNPEKSINNIFPCPFCSSNAVGHAYIKRERKLYDATISCSDCGASGPICKSGKSIEEKEKADEEAVNAWNQLQSSQDYFIQQALDTPDMMLSEQINVLLIQLSRYMSSEGHEKWVLLNLISKVNSEAMVIPERALHKQGKSIKGELNEN